MKHMSLTESALVLVLVVAVPACSPQQQEAPAAAATTAATPPAGDAPIPPTASPYDALPEAVRTVIEKPFTGDFDEMVKRRSIRAGVVFNRTHYFIDKGQERGLAFESLKNFETELNGRLKTGNLKVHVVMVPMTRDQLYPALSSGKVDLVAAMVTVTPEREKLVAFSTPTRTNVSQVVVTGPGAPPIAALDDLAGQEVFVRKGSIYAESLAGLNAQLKKRGKPEVVIADAPEVLEDEDVLEMVNAGLTPITVVDDYMAEFWSTVFTSLTVHKDVAVRSGGSLAVAFRRENPKLRETVNAWLAKHGEGDAFRNVIERRYLQSVKYAKNAAADTERKKFQAVVGLFKKYGTQYDLDFLLMAAQGYQESTLDQDVKSPVGAIGVMQVMPATGKELKVGDITKVEANIHAGVKYMRFMMDQYFKDEPMDDLNKMLITFASYNAGPGRVRQLRREAEKKGLNPNVWFGNVERVASERIGRETVTYVSNIFKYYIAYRLSLEQRTERAAAKSTIGKGK
jgi:membrane-bound lytic murein transglycosylase MltF